MTTLWDKVADIVDPPPWSAPNRAPLLSHQIPPKGNWKQWVLMGGRGCGKTEASSRYFAQYMHRNPGARGRIIAPTFADAIAACIEGPSGLKAIDPEATFIGHAVGGAKVIWPNGSEARIYGTDKPESAERFRAGGNVELDWWEELAACRYLWHSNEEKSCWDQAAFGLRIGEHPHTIASTTPRNRKFFKKLLGWDSTVTTHATIDDNPHLNEEWKRALKEKYHGTRLGKQELLGLLIEDIEGALWKTEWIERGRVEESPDFARIVISIDIATTKTESSDETGIVAVGRGYNRHCYVLGDMSGKYTPDEWAQKAIFFYDNLKADAIVYEANNGGDTIPTVIRHHRKNVRCISVSATRDKKTRAEPVAHQYEIQPPTVHHVDYLPELEEQMTTWDPMESKESPDRVDALVWGVTHLTANTPMLGKD